MVISDRYRFLFVHIPKSAGTSCAAALRAGLPWWERPQFQTRRGSKHRTLTEGLEIISRPRSLPFASPPQTYLTFAFVRNPWDRIVSVFHYLQKTRGAAGGIPESFQAFVRCIEQRDPAVESLRSMRSQCSYLTDRQGNLAVDIVGRFESLAEDFDAIVRRIGLKTRLPHVNASRHEPYTSYYDDWSREVIAERFADDILEFGYRYDGTAQRPQRLVA